jgi:uncharacterized membrane protein
LSEGDNKKFENTIAYLLRAGVTLSALVVFASGICYLIGHGRERPAYRIFQPAIYRNITSVVKGIYAGDCQAMIQFGLLLLIATPVVRVAVSLVEFARERDHAYTAITLIVLAVLLYALS